MTLLIKVPSFRKLIAFFIERNKDLHYLTFYNRFCYVAENFHRYSNDTMANCMFDAKLHKYQYAKLNAKIDLKTYQFYATTTFLHTLSFMGTAFFFRMRKVSFPAVLLISFVYSHYFSVSNSILYKLIVDRNVNNLAKQLGLHQHVQPIGSFKPRELNYY